MRFNAIGNGRFSAFLTRSFWLKTGEAAAPSLADEITPTIDVNAVDDLAAPFLRGERWSDGYATTGAPGALNYAKIALRNPPGSNVVCIIDRVGLFTSTAGEIFGVLAELAGPGTVGAARMLMDTRWWPISTGLPVCNVQQVNDTIVPPGVTNPPLYHQIAAGFVNTRIPRDVRVVLAPGYQLVFSHSVVATPSLIVDFSWRERPINQEELATG